MPTAVAKPYCPITSNHSAHGINTVPTPSIGNTSIIATTHAKINGYFISKPNSL